MLELCWMLSVQWVIFPRYKFSQMVLALAETFPIQKFTSPTSEKSYVSEIMYKAYMSKNIICQTFTMSTVFIVLHSCIVTTCTCISTGVYNNSRFSTVLNAIYFQCKQVDILVSKTRHCKCYIYHVASYNNHLQYSSTIWVVVFKG